MKMKFTRIANNKAVTVAKLNLKDTVLFRNSVCMLVARNGHTYLLDLATGTEAKGAKADSEVVPIECEMTYKVL